MSGPALFKVGQVWHYRYQVDGQRVQRSTRETVRRRAEAIASKAYEDAKLWARGQAPMPTLEELAEQWLATHEAVLSDAHVKTVDAFRRLHLYALGPLLLDQVTTEAVEQARNQHLRTHAPSSTNQWLAILKLLMLWAVKRGMIPKLPWQVRMLKVQRKPKVTLPPTSAAAWLAALDRAATPAVATAVRLMFGLGLRESEAASARWEWMDWDRATYTPGITKGREADPVPVPGWLSEHLRPLRQVRGLIAPSAPGADGLGRPYAPGFARDAMRAANAACGLGNLTPHRLRGTFATMLSEAGVPIQTIQRVMRHKDPMTTMKYLEANLQTAAAGQDRVAERIGLTNPGNQP